VADADADADADGEPLAAGLDAAALDVTAGAEVAAALADAAARAAFLADTADMLAISSTTARATPTSNVMIGVLIFMPRGTQHGLLKVQPFYNG
jgi:hypothetical protein